MDRIEAARELAVPLEASADDVERAFRRVAEARTAMLRPRPRDPARRVVEVVVRYHPVVRALTAAVRVLGRVRPPGTGR